MYYIIKSAPSHSIWWGGGICWESELALLLKNSDVGEDVHFINDQCALSNELDDGEHPFRHHC